MTAKTKAIPASAPTPDATDADVWNALQGAPAVPAATSPAPYAAGDATDADVLQALASGPQGAAVASQAPWYEHYPALAAQAIARGVTAGVNLPGEVADFTNRYTAPFVPKVLSTPIASLPAYFAGKPTPTDVTATVPEVPTPDFGTAAVPRNVPESLVAAGLSGGTMALLGGGLARVSALLEAGGKGIAREVPSLLREAGILGVAPGVAAEGANQALDLSKAPPAVKASAEMGAGMLAAVAAHRFAPDAFDTVPGRLGTSETAEDAGKVVQEATRAWRAELPAKVEALRDVRDVPVTPEGDVTAPAMFGKVPLHSATTDMSQTMAMANELAGAGGKVSPLVQMFEGDMPAHFKGMLDAIAEGNNPIKAYPPKTEMPYSGPLRPDTSPIVEGERGDLATGPGRQGQMQPVVPPGLLEQHPPTLLLGRPTETPIAHTAPAAQTNPLQQRMVSPEVLGGRPGVEASPVQLPSTVLRSSSPTETTDPAMTGSKQVGRPATGWDGPFGPQGSVPPKGPSQGVATTPGEEPFPEPTFAEPSGTTVGFPLPLQDAMRLRSAVGQAIASGAMPRGGSAGQVKALYAALSSDIGHTMDLYGARPEWDAYNTATSKLYTDGEKLSKFSDHDLESKDNAHPGAAVSSMWGTMAKDSGDIATVREHLPQAADEIAAAYLRQNPDKWGSLVAKNPDAARALVPNPFDRLALNSSVGEKLSLAEEAKRSRQDWGATKAGAALGSLLEAYNYSHTGSPLMSPVATAATIGLLPNIARFVGNLGRNPRLLKVPATGALATTPLLGDQSKGQ